MDKCASASNAAHVIDPDPLHTQLAQEALSRGTVLVGLHLNQTNPEWQTQMQGLVDVSHSPLKTLGPGYPEEKFPLLRTEDLEPLRRLATIRAGIAEAMQKALREGGERCSETGGKTLGVIREESLSTLAQGLTPSARISLPMISVTWLLTCSWGTSRAKPMVVCSWEPLFCWHLTHPRFPRSVIGRCGWSLLLPSAAAILK
jgi:hypothetical protein